MIIADIIKISENVRILKAFAENHPSVATLEGFLDADTSVAQITFSRRQMKEVIAAVGAVGWMVALSYRGDRDIYRIIDGVRLIVRDAEIPTLIRPPLS